MKRMLACSVVVLTTFAVAALHATGDEIRIVAGTHQQPLDLTGTLHVTGAAGVRIDAALDPTVASFGWGFCDLAPACAPGDVVSLRSFYGAHPAIFTGSGQVKVRGRTYSLFDEAVAEFQFDGAFVAPAFTDADRTEVSAPFAFSGVLQVPSQREPGAYDVFELHGSGVATALLSRSLYHAGWVVNAIRYDFVPRGNVIVQ
jgi:hypothetical protein